MKIKTLIAVLLLSCSFCNYKDVEVVFASQEVSQDEMVNKVILMIDSLPKNCTLEHEKDVKSCRNAYDNLLPSQKVLVTNLLDLLEKENQIALLYSEISYVVSLIDSLPDVSTFELDQEKKLYEVIEKYNELDNLQKELVSNYSKLEELSNKVKTIYKSINEIVSLIDSLPKAEHIDSSIYTLIDKIDLLYSSLSETQKLKITNINKYNEVKNIINKINILIECINNIPLNLKSDDLALLNNIYDEYNKLTVSQKSLVTNYNEFNVLYTSILEALDFNDLILELIPFINFENRYFLSYLLDKYNAFNDNQKVFIDNYYLLIELQEEINKEEIYFNNAKVVVDLINKLPLEITLNDKENVNNIRNKYDALDINEKKYVSNYHLLLNAEAKIIQLENELDKEEINELYNELNSIIDEVNNTLDEVSKKEVESESLVNEIKSFLDELKKNEEKGLNKYLIIAIGLTSVFIIVAIIYIFSLHQSKINIDKEII